MRFIIAACGLVFAGLIVWAIATGDFGAAGAWLTSNPWGIVTLADLYLGFLISGSIIAAFERNAMRTLLWCLPLPVLGNVWMALWIFLRWHRLMAVFSGARARS